MAGSAGISEVETLLCVYVSRGSTSLQSRTCVLRRPAHVEEVLHSRWKHDVPGTKPSRATLSRGEFEPVLTVEKRPYVSNKLKGSDHSSGYTSRLVSRAHSL